MCCYSACEFAISVDIIPNNTVCFIFSFVRWSFVICHVIFVPLNYTPSFRVPSQDDAITVPISPF